MTIEIITKISKSTFIFQPDNFKINQSVTYIKAHVTALSLCFFVIAKIDVILSPPYRNFQQK